MRGGLCNLPGRGVEDDIESTRINAMHLVTWLLSDLPLRQARA